MDNKGKKIHVSHSFSKLCKEKSDFSWLLSNDRSLKFITSRVGNPPNFGPDLDSYKNPSKNKTDSPRILIL